MHAVYVVAPDTYKFFPGGLESHPGDGHEVDWVVTNTIGTLKELVAVIQLIAAKKPINVLRLLGHGAPGSVAILGVGNREAIDFSKYWTEAINDLRDVFDRAPGHRRELFLHSCEAANDDSWRLSDGNVVGGPKRDKYGTMGAPGFTLLQGLANKLLVPTIGSIEYIYIPSHLSARGNYNWTMPRSLYVYPNADPQQALELSEVRGWGASLGGKLEGTVRGTYTATRNAAGSMFAHVLSGTGSVDPLGPVWVSGNVTNKDGNFNGTVRLNAKSGSLSLTVGGKDTGVFGMSTSSTSDLGSGAFDYRTEKGEGDLANSQFQGPAAYTWRVSASKNRSYDLRFKRP